MPRPTLADIARESNVSLATVDRVMNARGGASERTQAIVRATAARLGYLLDVALAPDYAAQPVRLMFLFPQGTNAFVRDLQAQINLQAPQFEGVNAQIETIEGFEPEIMAARLKALEGTVDGVAVLALDHPLVREALRSLIASGTHVVTIGSDILQVPHHGYIGIDDAQAGRLAGYIVGRLLGRGARGKVAFFAGSLAYRGHQEREIGFRQVLTQDFCGLQIVECREIQENRDKAKTEMIALIERHPDLAAVYSAGGGTAGIAAGLAAQTRDRNMVFIAHDLTDSNKSLLLNGTLDAVIDQNARVEIREALNTLIHATRQKTYRMVPPRLQIIFKENLPGD
ncbi:MAG: LacI family DNA-binding transcriptional regulator [Paracoccaceae bacterium]